MAEKCPTRRRWFQFSLRTFLVVVVLVGFGGAWVGMQLQQKRRHEAAVKEIVKSGGKVYLDLDTEEVPAWKEWLFGSYVVKSFSLHLTGSGATDSLLSQTQGMNLATLNLSSSKVTNTGLSYLNGLVGLESLILDRTHVTDAGLMHLKGLVSLKSLALNNLQITDAGLTHLQGLPRLEYLDLGYTRVTDAGLKHLKGLTRLDSLDLNHTQITGAGLKHLKGATSLEWLDLSHTHVTDIGLIHLKGLVSLIWLDLDNTQVTHAGVDKLQKAIPGCTIHYSTEDHLAPLPIPEHLP